MGKAGKTNPPAKTDESVKVRDKAKTPAPRPDTDDDYEDGDIATPKQDRYGTDDEPL
jgi:hypothetical protein